MGLHKVGCVRWSRLALRVVCSFNEAHQFASYGDQRASIREVRSGGVWLTVARAELSRARPPTVDRNVRPQRSTATFGRNVRSHPSIMRAPSEHVGTPQTRPCRTFHLPGSKQVGPSRVTLELSPLGWSQSPRPFCFAKPSMTLPRPLGMCTASAACLGRVAWTHVG